MHNRPLQAVLIVSTLGLCWLVMQAVHECGHVLLAWASGGHVQRVVLSPWEISRTDVQPDPHPRFVAWGGPILGSLLPIAAWLVWRRFWPARAWWFRFFTGFCLIANGAYLFAGSFFPVGDAETLLRNGASRIELAGFGIAALTGGLALWNRLGRHFGVGSEALRVDQRVACVTAVALGVLIAVEALLTT